MEQKFIYKLLAKLEEHITAVQNFDIEKIAKKGTTSKQTSQDNWDNIW